MRISDWSSDVCSSDLLPLVEDPSNSDIRFDRARLRQALRSQTILDPQAAARSAAWLDDADAAIDWAVAGAIAGWAAQDDGWVLRDRGFPDEILRLTGETRLGAHL